MKISKKQRKKVEEVIRQGLVRGLGEPRPGETCLEGAISLAMGYPHGDTPSCVAVADRTLAIALNDMFQCTPVERAKLLLPIGLAQLGTAGEDRSAWVRALVLGTIRRVLPALLEAYGLDEHARACRDARDLEEGAKASRAAASATQLAMHIPFRAYSTASAARCVAADAAAGVVGGEDAEAVADAVRRVHEEFISVVMDAYRAEGRA